MIVKFLIISNYFVEQTTHGWRCLYSLGLLLTRMIPNTTINNAEAGYDSHLTAVPRLKPMLVTTRVPVLSPIQMFARFQWTLSSVCITLGSGCKTAFRVPANWTGSSGFKSVWVLGFIFFPNLLHNHVEQHNLVSQGSECIQMDTLLCFLGWNSLSKRRMGKKVCLTCVMLINCPFYDTWAWV